MILGNYSYYWIYYEFCCIYSSFHCLLCINVCLYIEYERIKDDLFASGIVFLLQALIYLIILFIVNICKTLRFPDTQM